jgi:tRNA(Met) cytidine acetyltransferase
MPPDGPPPPPHSFAVRPYSIDDVSSRFFDRMQRCLLRSPAVALPQPIDPSPGPVEGTEEQRRVVDRIARHLSSTAPCFAVLTADRGRGKSSALGLALRQAMRSSPFRAVVTAPTQQAASEVFRFASSHQLPFVPPMDLARSPSGSDVVVVDEAAQLPVPVLRELVARHPNARIAFATTTHGYEGTGRGFALRFLPWLEQQPRPLLQLSLTEPIRWAPDDPLERLVFDALALDADIAPARGELSPFPKPVLLDRDELARNEVLLRSLFGLLVHGHYRTTPSDFHRMLDAPNLAVHALVRDGEVLAATLVGREGDLDRPTCEALAAGKMRLRGHALADTLITHAGRPDAGELSIVRSVRIVTQPGLRKRGLARALIDHVHRRYTPDLFGTLFGATPDLIAFRRSVGYELVRVGAARGERTGEPAAIMLRAHSKRAAELVRALRADLSRDLPIQLALLHADGILGLEPGLAASLSEGLAPPVELDPSEIRQRVQRYANGPQTFASAAYAICRFVETHRSKLSALDSRECMLLEGHVLAHEPWDKVARQAGFPSLPAAMRALRPAIRKLLASTA